MAGATEEATGSSHGGGGHGGKPSGSLFRIGDNVHLSVVLVHLCILVAFIMVFEQMLHRGGHHLAKYPKYHEMMTKVFGELMILGLIGLGVKLAKETIYLDSYSETMIAFQAADITVFILALALIVQALSVFLQLRKSNIQMDRAELISSQHLVDLMQEHQVKQSQSSVCNRFGHRMLRSLRRADTNTTTIAPEDYDHVATARILRHFFLRTHKLPELFPFSKYLRQAQDTQISHMIEVEASTWIILLALAWVLEAMERFLSQHSERGGMQQKDAIALTFLVVSWLSVLFHGAVDMYFNWALEKLHAAAVHGSAEETTSARQFDRLKDIAAEETQTIDHELAMDAIAVMEHVREEELRKKTTYGRQYWMKDDTGFQLATIVASSIWSKLGGSSDKAQGSTAKPPAHGGEEESDVKATISVHVQHQETGLPPSNPLQLRSFSRKAWHFVVMTSMMINGFYLALFCQCVLYQMGHIRDEFGLVIMVAIPLPLLFDVLVLQPRIMRNFILAACIFRVDVAALGDVIDHFTETIQLRAELAQAVNRHMALMHLTLADLETDLQVSDASKSGMIEVEDLRRVLHRYGFKLSFFRFNSVVKLLFRLQGTLVEHSQVLQLVQLGQSEAMHAFFAESDHLTANRFSYGYYRASTQQQRDHLQVPGLTTQSSLDDDDTHTAMLEPADEDSARARGDSTFVRAPHQLKRGLRQQSSTALRALYRLDSDLSHHGQQHAASHDSPGKSTPTAQYARM